MSVSHLSFLRTVVVFFCLLFVVLLSPLSVSAYDVVLETGEVGSDNFGGVGGGVLYFPAPIGVTFTATAVAQQYTDNPSYPYAWGIQLGDDAGFVDCISEIKVNADLGIGSEPSVVTFPLSGTQCDFDSADAVRFNYVTAPDTQNSNSINAANKWGTSGAPSGGDVYAVVYTGDAPIGPVVPQNTRIITPPVEPVHGTTTASTTVDFDIRYYLNQSLEGDGNTYEIYLQFINYSTMSSEGVPASPSPTTLTDYGSIENYQVTVAGFTENNLYGWRAIIQNAETNQVLIQGGYYQFSVVSQPEGDWNSWGGYGTTSTSTLSELDVSCNPSDPFWERSICNVAVLLFIPSADDFNYYHMALEEIPNKFPFSFFYAFVNPLQSINPSNEENTTFTLDLTDSVYAGEIDFISPDSVDRFLTTEHRLMFRDVMAYALWLAFAVMVFFRVRAIFR